MMESLILALSYPLRLMATTIAVGSLRMFGVAVSAERTLITLDADGVALAVTDACGGIEQLAGLVIVGGIFAFMMQRRAMFRMMHWAAILPCLVVANAIRLIITILLVRSLGEVALGNTWHIALGWTQTVLVVFFLWAIGKLLKYTIDGAPDESQYILKFP